MSDSFTKVFASILDSTIWGESPATCKVWITMLAMADQRGQVLASLPGLARRAVVSIDEASAAIECFMAPDKYSRTPDNDGRRVCEIDGGWALLNYEKYRAKRSAAERAEYQREWDREHRGDRPSAAKRAHPTPDKPPTTPDNPRQTPTQAEAEKAEAEQSIPRSVETLSPDDSRALATDPPERSSEAEPEPPRERPTPTPAGAACLAMLAEGVHRTNPHDPRLLELIDAGASTDQFRAAAADAVHRGKPNQGYALGIVRGQMTEAAQIRGSPTPLAKPIPRGMEGVVRLEELKSRMREENHGNRLADNGNPGGTATPIAAAAGQLAADG